MSHHFSRFVRFVYKTVEINAEPDWRKNEYRKQMPGDEPTRRHTAAGALSNGNWWPNQLNLQISTSTLPCPTRWVRSSTTPRSSKHLTSMRSKQDIFKLMTTSQDWWPADYGHYGPFFIRMAWHSAGTYRIADGRGGAGAGTLRFAPLNSWPDNVNLDKARRLLWPIKQKYGRKLSWADLMIFTGNCALESMGLKTFGFGGGREDVWEPEGDVYWGPESEWLGDERYTGDRELENPLGAVQMGLIYVNPEGPNGNPDPIAAARDIRETFGRMAMNDEETVALIAGGHTFGKAHGAADPEPVRRSRTRSGRSGRARPRLEEQLRQRQRCRHDQQRFGRCMDHRAGEVGQQLLRQPVRLRVGADEKPRWRTRSGLRTMPRRRTLVPDAHDPSKKHAPIMFTTDLSLRMDPIYGPISKRFHENPDEFAEAFAKAWYKLTHRDMGPVSSLPRLAGSAEPQLWQDPIPEVDHELIGEQDIADLKAKILASGLVHFPTGLDRLGVGVNVPRHRQTRRRQRGPHSTRAAEGLGSQPASRTGEGVADAGADPSGLQQLAVRRQKSLARGRDRVGRVCRR